MKKFLTQFKIAPDNLRFGLMINLILTLVGMSSTLLSAFDHHLGLASIAIVAMMVNAGIAGYFGYKIVLHAPLQPSKPFSLCACMGPIGDDPLCPCAMTNAGLVPTPIWTDEKKDELRTVLNDIFGHNQKGFTLIELLIVIAIIGILVAVGIDGVQKNHASNGGYNGRHTMTLGSPQTAPLQTGITNDEIIAEAVKCKNAGMDSKVFYVPALNDAGIADHVGCVPIPTVK